MTVKNELLDIFKAEKDRNETDLLKITNFFDLLVSKTKGKFNDNSIWKNNIDIRGMIGEIATAIKCGIDINGMKTLVADGSHFSKEIVDGLKSGLYHIGESKEVAGNMRPAIVDLNGRIVKHFTLKKACNPSTVLTDVANISMQNSLKNISMQLDDISQSINELTEFVRADRLNNPFLNARDRIIRAATASEDDRKQFLHEADKYLMEGLNALYGDVEAQISELISLKWYRRGSNRINSYLKHITDDMQMIPRYVGLRTYLFLFLGKAVDANRVLENYGHFLEKMIENKVKDGKYTSIEVIHDYYKYNKNNVGFWLETPPKMLGSLRSFNKMIEIQTKEIYFIQAEG